MGKKRFEKLPEPIRRMLDHAAVWALLFLASWIIHAIAKGFLGQTGGLYLLGWTTHNLYWGFWVLPILLAALGRNLWAWSITWGNLIGVLLGQTLGEYLEALDVDNLMDFHKGFQIWIGCVLLGIVAGAVGELILKQRRK